ncbi:MAG TPA: RNA-binding domain-containing protein [Nostocaceae cyanobacterium]|nr:RNA-binding domain-containing protein [Kamptonema sp.]HLO86172.1 RNA-binding domain-containing protein [Nostocaceae cyanobacterium]
MALDLHRTRDLLHEFKFGDIFVYQLGWSFPPTDKAVAIQVEGETYHRQMIAELSGVVVFEITGENGQIPNAKTRAAIHKEISELTLENLLIFLDKERTQSLWYWVKRDGTKRYVREHLYVKGQPGDLFLGKLASLVVDLSELEDGLLSVVEVARRLQAGLDVERVTKNFFKEFQSQLEAFIPLIQGIDKEADKRWYASVIFNRLMFIYFLQYKGFLDNGDHRYLQSKLEKSQQRETDCYYQEFLQTLFFEGFAQPESQRKKEVKALIGNIKYLNGGLFLKHKVEQTYNNIFIPDSAFESILNLFGRYSWQLDDTPGGQDDEINPGVLGYIFEKYINQKAFGAYYTRPEITEYLCDRTINALILDRINAAVKPRQFESISELLIKLDADICHRLIFDILPKLSLLDPACGSGAFLVAALKTLINIYSAVIGRIEFLNNHNLKDWLQKERSSHPSLSYFIKKRIITDNLYGVDIMEEATEIAKLRLFLALVSSAQEVDDLEPLPNVDFNIMAGNSLIGLIRVDGDSFDSVDNSKAVQGNLLQALAAQNYQSILADKNKSIELYKKHAFLQGEHEELSQEVRLLQLRNHIEKLNQESQAKLNLLLLDEFSAKLGIKYEQEQLSGRPRKRLLTVADIAALEPFHWGYHFDEIIGKRGGFDAIITNPPWDVFQTDEKEFFYQYDNLIKKKKLDIKTWEQQREQLLTDPEIQEAWLNYCSSFPHVSAYFKKAEQYKNQRAEVEGRSVARKINLYFLFLEQCFNLLSSNGCCGIIVPTGFYSDLGTKQLREMLFSKTRLDTILGFSNERFIFEGVHHSVKFCLLTFKKDGLTESFRAAFRINPREAISPKQLESFLNNKAEQVEISVQLIRRLSPDSLSVMEFKNEVDIHIAKNMAKFPLLGKKINGKWNLSLKQEFNMTSDSPLFKQKPSEGRLPLYEGKMIHQFTHRQAEPRYWVDEKDGRKALLGRKGTDQGQKLDYQSYRLGFRDVARNTDVRTMIASITPPNVFAGNTLILAQPFTNSDELLFAVSVLNSFACDFVIRQKVTAHCNMFYVYQLPVPRLGIGDTYFNEIVERAAKLICTTPEFDELAQEVGLDSYQNGVKDETERAKLRAELDGMIANIYGLTEEEFAYILTTFPVVPEPVKQAALDAYKTFKPLSGDPEIIYLITKGECDEIEFKSTARWNLRENKRDEAMEHEIVKTVAAFLNTNGGNLLIGIDDNGEVLGLQYDYKTLGKKNNDGYMLFLNHDLLLRELGKDYGTLFRISFHQVSGLDVCRVVVQPSPKPVYIKVKDKNGNKEDCLFIRANNSSVKLNIREAVEYCKNHWG